MISKELLSEVLGISLQDAQEIVIVDNEIFWTGGDINIYELSHKCKEWAWDLGYEVSSKKDLEDRNWYTSFRANEDLWVCRKSDTEPEAIFEACQWVLGNKGK